MPADDRISLLRTARRSSIFEPISEGRNAISAPEQPTGAVPVPTKVVVSQATLAKNRISARRSQTPYHRETIDSLLCHELAENVQSGISVEDFVRLVWRFDPDRLVGTHGEIDIKYCREYMKVPERGRYAKLKKIFDDVITKIRLSQDANWLVMGDHTPIGRYSSFKPDMVYTVQQDRHAMVWDWILVTLEMKLSARTFPVHRCKGKFKVGDKRKDREDGDEASDRGAEVVYFGQDSEPPAKKARLSHERSGSSHRPSTQSTDAVSLTRNEYQLGSYIHECMANGLRSYASGILIRDTSIQLWYADRMGVVRSGKFDFLLKPQYMYLVLAAIASSSLHKFGYNSMVEFRDEEGTVLELKHPSTLSNSLVILPNPIDANGDHCFSDNLDKPSGPLKLEIAENGPRYIQYGLIARGTTIVAVKSPKRWGCGRKLIVKMGWPVKCRIGEDEFIRTIRNKISPKWLDNIVDMKCSQTIDRQDFDLPRNQMHNLNGHKPEERVFRVLILEEYLPLTAVDSADEFKAVFLDAVRGHHYAYEEAGVLHRDLSDNNIMFRRHDGCVFGVLCDWDLAAYRDHLERQSQRHSYGVKNNGNTGSHGRKSCGDGNETKVVLGTIAEGDKPENKNEDEMESNTPNHRTGTGPFMAIDLLRPDTPVHRYRHDLESFFYIAIWFSTLFEPREHKYRKSAKLKIWESGDFPMIMHTKTYFLAEPTEYTAVTKGAVGDYDILLRDWIWPLYSAFNEMVSITISSRVVSRRAERETLEHETQKRIDSLVNYTEFMTNLGASEL